MPHVCIGVPPLLRPSLCLPGLGAARLTSHRTTSLYSCSIGSQSVRTAPSTSRHVAVFALPRQQAPRPEEASVSVRPEQAQPPAAPSSGASIGNWLGVGLVFCLTVSSLAGAYIVSVLYLKPLLKKVEKVLAEADVAAKDLDIAAKVWTFMEMILAVQQNPRPRSACSLPHRCPLPPRLPAPGDGDNGAADAAGGAARL